VRSDSDNQKRQRLPSFFSQRNRSVTFQLFNEHTLLVCKAAGDTDRDPIVQCLKSSRSVDQFDSIWPVGLFRYSVGFERSKALSKMSAERLRLLMSLGMALFSPDLLSISSSERTAACYQQDLDLIEDAAPLLQEKLETSKLRLLT